VSSMLTSTKHCWMRTCATHQLPSFAQKRQCRSPTTTTTARAQAKARQLY